MKAHTFYSGTNQVLQYYKTCKTKSLYYIKQESGKLKGKKVFIMKKCNTCLVINYCLYHGIKK